MDWVEVQGESVDDIVGVAMKELGVVSREDVTVEVIQEAKASFLGMGGKDAIVRVTRAPRKKKRRRGRGRSSGRGDANASSNKQSSQQGGGSKQSNDNRAPDGTSNRDSQARDSKNNGRKPKNKPAGRPRQENQVPKSDQNQSEQRNDDRPEQAPIEEQAKVAAGFITGLLDAFGLEGDVNTRIEEDVLYIDVEGAQTEALVGPKGSVMQSVHELTRTVVQRKTYGAPRMRIDIAGYRARRREALKIYAGKLAEQIIEDKDEIMLEPMNAADRKVVHDAVTDIENVRSFSEGEEPRRSVVLSYTETS